MTLTFPNSDLMDERRFQRSRFMLDRGDRHSRQGNGQILSISSVEPLWRAVFQTVPMTASAAVNIEALLDSQRGAQRSFYAYDWRIPYPVAHPTGSFTDGATVATVPSDTSLTLQGADAGFTITRGDKLHMDNGSMRWLGRAMESVTANGSGAIAAFDVEPALPTWAAADVAVVFKKPSCRMKLIPGSLDPDTVDDFTSITFEAIQTF